MEKLILEKPQRITKNKEKLEKKLEIKIGIKGSEITIDGSPENEYIAEKVIDALEFGFPFSVALLIKEEDFIFEVIKIKDYTRRKDLTVVKARVIGKGGKALRTLNHLTKCYFEIKDYLVGVVGEPKNIKTANEAMIYLIQGSKHSNVYSFLEKHQIKPILDLGLKKIKKPKS